MRKEWLIGFIEGEGTLSSSKLYNKPVIDITQHVADYDLMGKVKSYIGSSPKVQILKDQTCKVTVTDRNEIKEKVLPLLYKQLYTDKKVKAFEKHWPQDTL